MGVIKSRTMRGAGHLTGMGEKRNALKRVLVGKAERKITLGRLPCRW
jgi:hypothetical protein